MSILTQSLNYLNENFATFDVEEPYFSLKGVVTEAKRKPNADVGESQSKFTNEGALVNGNVQINEGHHSKDLILIENRH